MRKRRVVWRICGMKYSWKGHNDRNRHKNRIKRSGQARLVYAGTTSCENRALNQTTGRFMSDINCNIPTTWRWAHGDPRQQNFSTCGVVAKAVTGFCCLRITSRFGIFPTTCTGEDHCSEPENSLHVRLLKIVMLDFTMKRWIFSFNCSLQNVPESAVAMSSTKVSQITVYRNRVFFCFFFSEFQVGFSFSPDVILCGWLGLKHQLTN